MVTGSLARLASGLNMTTNKLNRGWIVLALLTIYGCGAGNDQPELYPVVGSVRYQGAPVEGAAVVFKPQGEGDHAALPSPSAITAADGTFRLQTFHEGTEHPGAAAGEYVVTIEKRGPAGDISKSPTPPEHLLPVEYADSSTSPLRANVRPNETIEFDFVLSDSK